MNILIHGILTKSPEKSIGKFKRYIKDARLFSYGYIGVLGALFKNKSIAKKLAKLINSVNESGDKVTVYAHSNANAISVIAAKKYGAKIENFICLGAALNRNITFPDSIKNILVISTKKDKATKAARFFDSMPVIGWMVPDIWGSMGTDNYTGNDKRVTKIFLDDIDDTLDDHGDYFSDEDLPKINKLIINWLLSLD